MQFAVAVNHSDVAKGESLYIIEDSSQRRTEEKVV